MCYVSVSGSRHERHHTTQIRTAFRDYKTHTRFQKAHKQFSDQKRLCKQNSKMKFVSLHFCRKKARIRIVINAYNTNVSIIAQCKIYSTFDSLSHFVIVSRIIIVSLKIRTLSQLCAQLTFECCALKSHFQLRFVLIGNEARFVLHNCVANNTIYKH